MERPPSSAFQQSDRDSTYSRPRTETREPSRSYNSGGSAEPRQWSQPRSEAPRDYSPPARVERSEPRYSPPARVERSEPRYSPPARVERSEPRYSPPARVERSEPRSSPQPHQSYERSQPRSNNNSGGGGGDRSRPSGPRSGQPRER